MTLILNDPAKGKKKKGKTNKQKTVKKETTYIYRDKAHMVKC